MPCLCDTLSSQSWHLLWQCACILPCIALAPRQHCARSLLLSCRRPRQHCVGALALDALAPLPCRAGFISLVALACSHWQCCLQHIVIAELASLPRLHWHPCKHHAGVVTVVVLASSPSSRCVFALALVPPRASRWRLSHHAGGIVLVALVSAQLQRCDQSSLQSWRPCEHCADIPTAKPMAYFEVDE